MEIDDKTAKALYELLRKWKMNNHRKDFEGTEDFYKQLDEKFKGGDVFSFLDPMSPNYKHWSKDE